MKHLVVLLLVCLLAVAQNSNTTSGNSTGTTNETDTENKIDMYMINLVFNICVIVFGILFCFVGYRIFRFTFFIAGLLIGFGVTYMILESKVTFLIALVIAGGVGLIFGILFTFVAAIGIFATGAILGLAIATVVLATPVGDMITSNGIQWLHFVIMLGAAVVFGVIALLLQKFIMIIGTSFGGSFMMATAVDAILVHSNFSTIIPNALNFHFDTLLESEWKVYVMIAGFAVFGIIGSVVQFRVTARNYNHNKKSKKDKKNKKDKHMNEYSAVDQLGGTKPNPDSRRTDPVSRSHTHSDRVPLRDRSRNY
jgi:hypothetical protein